MTVKQAQWQIWFLDYYKGTMDGIWGQLSKAGTKAFQKDNGLTQTGTFDFKSQTKADSIIRRIQQTVGTKVDGLAGPNTTAALKKWQQAQGMTPTGIAGPEVRAKILGTAEEPKADKPAAAGWEGIRYFKREEFRCKCGGRYCNGFPVEPDMEMVRAANEIRTRIGLPLPTNSGLRCRQHNANEGGASNSQHLYGTAVDLGKPAGVTPAQMAAVAEDVLNGGGGIGIYSWGIHIDTRKTKARWRG